MTCVLCLRRTPRNAVRREPLRKRGWFVWDFNGPRKYDGTVICPTCRKVLPTAAAAVAHYERAAKKGRAS